ncbi:MAG: oligosaccharide flippase family protein [Victivallaceae bacterium]|nr:oligosaccharide flippase family protein [Victivallaceae bacterium]
MKSTKIFIKGAVISVAATIVIAALNYLTRRLLALNLSQKEYGFFYSLFSLISFWMIFFNFGFGQTAVIMIAKTVSNGNRKQASRIYSALIMLNVLAGIATAVIMLLCSNYLLNSFFNYPAGRITFYIMLIFIPFQALYLSEFSTIEGLKDFRLRNILWSLFFIIIFVTVILGIKQYGLWLPATAYTGSAALVSLLGIVLLRKYHGMELHLSSKLHNVFIEMWQLARWVAVSVFVLTAMTYLDTIMLTYFKGLDSVAQYNVALPIMQIMLVMAIVPIVFIPIAAELWHEQKLEELRNILNGVTLLFIFLSWPALCFFTLFASRIISILFRPEYIPAATATALLCFGAFFAVLVKFYLNTLNATGNSRAGCLMIIGGGIFNIIANVVLIITMGINGAALATTLSYILTFLAMFYLANRKLRLEFPVVRVVLLSLIGGITVLGLVLFDFRQADLLTKAVAAVIAVGIYGLSSIVILKKFYLRLFKLSMPQLKIYLNSFFNR